jgi:hypothetical protein
LTSVHNQVSALKDFTTENPPRLSLKVDVYASLQSDTFFSSSATLFPVKTDASKGNSESPIATKVSIGLYHIINAIAPETDYEIYVSARVNGKYQALDNALYTSAVIPVTAPNSFEITSIEPTIVRIKWNAVKNADRYWARLVDDKGNTVMTKQSLKALISFTGLTPGKTYYVQLQARVPKSSGGNQYSGYCDPITVPITMPQA